MEDLINTLKGASVTLMMTAKHAEGKGLEADASKIEAEANAVLEVIEILKKSAFRCAAVTRI